MSNYSIKRKTADRLDEPDDGQKQKKRPKQSAPTRASRSPSVATHPHMPPLPPRAPTPPPRDPTPPPKATIPPPAVKGQQWLSNTQEKMSNYSIKRKTADRLDDPDDGQKQKKRPTQSAPIRPSRSPSVATQPPMPPLPPRAPTPPPRDPTPPPKAHIPPPADKGQQSLSNAQEKMSNYSRKSRTADILDDPDDGQKQKKRPTQNAPTKPSRSPSVATQPPMIPLPPRAPTPTPRDPTPHPKAPIKPPADKGQQSLSNAQEKMRQYSRKTKTPDRQDDLDDGQKQKKRSTQSAPTRPSRSPSVATQPPTPPLPPRAPTPPPRDPTPPPKAPIPPPADKGQQSLSNAQAGNGYDIYYHHTDRNSAKLILRSGYIKQSDPSQGDAVFGPGTYLTKNGPDKSRSVVARNNYDGTTNQFWESKIKDGKTDVAFEIKVKKGVVQPCQASDRDVHLYKGDLNLSSAEEVNIHVREKDGNVKRFTHK